MLQCMKCDGAGIVQLLESCLMKGALHVQPYQVQVKPQYTGLNASGAASADHGRGRSSGCRTPTQPRLSRIRCSQIQDVPTLGSKTLDISQLLRSDLTSNGKCHAGDDSMLQPLADEEISKAYSDAPHPSTFPQRVLCCKRAILS
jgi:hypothetical protein